MSEFDTLLQIAALAIGVAGGYVAVRYVLAAAVLKAVGTLVRGIQTIRAAKADGILTDAEYIQIGKDAVQLENDVGTCWILAFARKG